jgi:hypothetical protein
MNGVFVMADSRLAKIKRKGEEHLEHLRWNLTTSDLITIGLMDEDVDGGIDSYNSFLLRLSLPFLYFVFEGFCDEDLSV